VEEHRGSNVLQTTVNYGKRRKRRGEERRV
jgi:hypothetical protein